MRIMFLVLTVMLVASAAEAQVCDPAWLRNASYWDAKALLDAGVDANQICSPNRNRPLHQGLLNDRTDPGVIRALLEAGADPGTQNIHGETPFGYAQDRFDLARRKLRPGTAPYRREQALYEAVVGTFNDQGSAAEDAHAKLCDLNWWRSLPSYDWGDRWKSRDTSAIRSLLETPGVDPNHACNFNNDRPLHLLLKLESFPSYLSSGILAGIIALLDGGADLRIRNGSGQSARELVNIRWDRHFDRVTRNIKEWCNGNISDREFNSRVSRGWTDNSAYMRIESMSTQSSYDQIREKTFMNLYGTSIYSGIWKPDVCG